MRSRTVEVADPAAHDFVEWVRPHWEQMDRLALRLVGAQAAEDVVQEALAAAWRSRQRFDPAVGEARSWLLAIVVNKSRDQMRRAVDRSELPDDLASPARSAELAVDLTSALARLPERRRVAVALHYYLGLGVAECAAVMDCSVGTVKSTLSDARAQLRTILGEEYRS